MENDKKIGNSQLTKQKSVQSRRLKTMELDELKQVKMGWLFEKLPIRWYEKRLEDIDICIYKVLTGDVALRVRELVRQTCEAFEIKIIKGVVSKAHVHIFVSAPPTMVPSELMCHIKGRSSGKLFVAFPHLRKRFWGYHFRAGGFFVHHLEMLPIK